MVEKVNPSPNRPADAFTTAGAIAYGGGVGDTGFIVPADSPTDLSKQDSGITESTLSAFSESHSSTSYDVSIDAGEAFVFGSWVVIDDSPARTVTLNSDSLNQTVYLGWDKGSSNNVIIGLDSDFDNFSDNTDQRIPLYEFDTDTSGVSAVRDLRNIGDTFDSEGFNTDVDAKGNDLQNVSALDAADITVTDLINQNSFWASSAFSPPKPPSDTSSTTFTEIADLDGVISASTQRSGLTLYGNLYCRPENLTATETATYQPVVLEQGNSTINQVPLTELQLDVVEDDKNQGASTGWTEITSVDPTTVEMIAGNILQAKVTGGTLTSGVRAVHSLVFEWRAD